MATIFNSFDEDKMVLLDRIKDLNFVDDVSKFECKRCGNVLLQCYKSQCGHAFCSNCRSLLGDGSGQWKCPQCQEHVTQIDMRDFELERKMFDLRVRCANKKYGCPLTCLLKELREHLQSCEFTRENVLPEFYMKTNTKILEISVAKLNENFDKLSADMEAIKAKVESIQGAIDNKLKDINHRIDTVNSDLHVVETRINKKLAHFDTNGYEFQADNTVTCNLDKTDFCSKTNNTIQIKKSNVLDNVCAKSMVKDLEKKIRPHLSRLQSYINLLKLQVPPLMSANVYANREADFVWKILDAKNELKQEDFHNVESEVFQLSHLETEAQAELKFAFNEFSAVVSFIDVNRTGSELQTPCKPSMYLIIRNQVDERETDIVRTANKTFGCCENSDYHFHSIDKSMLDRFFTSYIKNNTLFLEFYLEPPSMTNHVFSYDGTLSWAVQNYKKRKHLEMSEYVSFHQSPYFYTDPRGYRVQLLMSFSGLHVSACLNFLSGHFDHQLDAEFKHRTTLTIVNQKNPSGHIVKSEVYDHVTINDWVRMGSHKEIENAIVNDTLHYHVKIQAV